jgi:hypothetical protein
MQDSTGVTIEVTLPQALLFDLGVIQEEAGHVLVRARTRAPAGSLYRRDRISSGKAARLLGVNRLAFIQMLAEEGIAYLDYTPAELDDELTTLKQ